MTVNVTLVQQRSFYTTSYIYTTIIYIVYYKPVKFVFPGCDNTTVLFKQQ